jgi:hypothetical protein
MAKNKASKPEAKASGGDDSRLKSIRERVERGRDFDRQNAELALFDMEFRAGLNQWSADDLDLRKGRPSIVENRIPQFVRQVTGDIRQMKPALRAFGVDDDSDPKAAETITEILRYIERVSDADDAYFRAVDSQVTCGIGHWRITTEYCDEENGVQDILIETVDDQINVIWDPDARKANREDASFCAVPVDMTMMAFKERYPDAATSGFSAIEEYRSSGGYSGDSWWSSGDTIRVCEFWERKRVKEKGGVSRWQVTRSVVTDGEVLEGPDVFPGRYIPIVPVIGEEVAFGDRTYRHGVTRFLIGPQQRLNHFISSQTEVASMQPKAPFMVTTKQVEDHVDVWSRAHLDNLPFLPYTPDPQAPGAPQRIAPPVPSSAFSEAVMQAQEAMKAVTGLYDASLGAKSNETSGKAILARVREGDVGTYVYVSNFLRALKHTGRILVDLIPRYFDTARTLRIMGDDGKLAEVKLNQPMPGVYMDGGEAAPVDPATNVTRGKYDVFVQPGPSYSTKRDEAREGMIALIQAFPPAAPVIADKLAMVQDWPDADIIGKRLATLLPPEIRAMEAESDPNAEDAQPPMPQGPSPEMMAQQQVMQAEQMKAEADMAMRQMDLQKRGLELQAAAQTSELKIAEMQAAAVAKAEMTRLDLLSQEARIMTEIVTRQQAAPAAQPANDDAGMQETAPDQGAMALQESLMAVRQMMEQVAQGQAMLAQAMLAPRQARIERAPDGAMVGTMQTMGVQ